MTLVVQRPVVNDQVPLHILIITVGRRGGGSDLDGAGDFTQDAVDFWQGGHINPVNGQKLSSVDVLSSDPGGVVKILGDGHQFNVDEPTVTKVTDAFLEWTKRIRKTKGVGILQWVGHGYTLTVDGKEGLSICCQSETLPDGTIEPGGLDWPLTKQGIDGLVNGRPVFCFLDVCRVRTTSVGYDGIGKRHPGSNSTQTYYSCSAGQSSFWMPPGKMKTVPVEFQGHAIGSRAFLASLKEFGARIEDSLSPTHDIMPPEILAATRALLKMWKRCLGINSPMNPYVDNGGDDEARLTLTSAPKAVVEVTVPFAANANSCEALHVQSSTQFLSQSQKTPYDFALFREPHQFRQGASPWSLVKHPITPKFPVKL
ncbi:hypothetical protein [Rhizobium leguminosarum]